MGYSAMVFVAIAAACISAGESGNLRARASFSPRDEPPLYVNAWAVEVEGGQKVADALAAKYGFINKGQIGILKDMYEFVFSAEVFHRQSRSTDVGYSQVTEALQREVTVKFAEQQIIRKMKKKGYQVPTDPDWTKQWFLSNSDTGVLQGNGDSTLDLNVEPAWIQRVTGCNVIVGVVDDGVEYSHQDLSSNYISERDLNAIADSDDDADDAFPGETDGERDSHGTSCAGIIAMEKSNDVCGVGVAYLSRIIGIRLIGARQTDIAEARALSHDDDIIDIYSNSWGPPDDGFYVLGPDILAQLTFRDGAHEGRDGKGSIFVWAAGNGGDYGDSCAADGYVQSIYTIAIGSVGSDSQPAFYDERCSAKLASTFVHNPFSDDLSVATTGAEGECVTDFDGTSAATPVASGTIALALEANPDLTWRDIQYLIVYTSNPDILSVDDLAINGAGLRFSHHFGFGAIDAEAMVTRARHWINVPEQQNFTMPISDNTVVQETSTEVITAPFSEELGSLEHVVVQLSTSFQDVDTDYYLENNVYDYLYEDFANYTDYYYDNVFPNRGDIQLELTSPQGTTSTLLPYRNRDSWPGEYYEWPFMSIHFWGEDPSGNWTLTVRNRGNGTVMVSDVEFIFYGTTATPEVISRIPQQCDSACARGCAAAGAEFCDSCSRYRDAYTLQCVEDCAEGLTLRSGYCYNATEPEPECIRRLTTEGPTVPTESPTVPTKSPTVPTESLTESDAEGNAVNLSSSNLLLVVVTIVVMMALIA